MNTIYILGKKGFRYVVSKQLSKTCKACLPGELIDHHTEFECQIYWLPESLLLPAFKRMVGAGIVFKYRLRFMSADEYYSKTNTTSGAYSEDEEGLLNEILNQEGVKWKKGKGQGSLVVQ